MGGRPPGGWHQLHLGRVSRALADLLQGFIKAISGKEGPVRFELRGIPGCLNTDATHALLVEALEPLDATRYTCG